MFCDQTLAARIEAAEVDLLSAATLHVRHRVRDAFAARIGGGLAACTEAGSPLNKVAGLGFAAIDEAAWSGIEAEHDRRELPLQVELSTLGDPAVATFLCERGHRLVGVENVLGRALLPTDFASAAPSGIAIEPCTDLPLWLSVMVTGFATPDTQGVVSHEEFDRAVLERVIGDFAAAEGVLLYLARCGGAPAGAGAMRVHGGVAQLCGAATLPAFRRRGVQTALLQQRLAVASERGAELCVMTTQPGSKSMQNACRQGFSLFYSRNVLVRSPRPGSR
jgi:ribosomal protein S18 acetylase RimI-like enzyme